MSRLFTSGFSAERITFAPTNMVPVDQGPATVLALARSTVASGTHWLAQAVNASGNPTWGLLIDNGHFYCEANFGPGGPAVPLGQWFWVAYTKRFGSFAPRWHLKNLDAGAAWVHIDDTTAVSDLFGPSASIAIGGPVNDNVSIGWSGNIAAVAAWNRPLSDGEIEAATASGKALTRAHPAWGTLLNQSDIGTPATDLSGYGSNQVAISGTSVSLLEPPGWSYGTGPAPQTIFGNEVPTSYDFSDNFPYTLGTRVQPQVDGVITHLKWFIPPTPQPTTGDFPLDYVFAIFDAAGNVIRQRAFPTIGLDGANWMDFPLSSPLRVTAGTTYTAAVYTPTRYVVTNQYPWPKISGDLVTPSTGGWFYSGWPLAYPHENYNASNYFVDVVFFPGADTEPPAGLVLTVWDGVAEVPATLSVWSGGVEVAASLKLAG